MQHANGLTSVTILITICGISREAFQLRIWNDPSYEPHINWTGNYPELHLHPTLKNPLNLSKSVPSCIGRLPIFIMALLHFAEVAFICTLSWVLWKTLRNFVVKSSLDNIPGPPSTSMWKGVTVFTCSWSEYWISLGNLGQLFSRDGWHFHDEIGEKYGAVVKITGLFNVRRCTSMITSWEST